ncbi:MAG TPA: isoaspartyl peptidase/L-asparaginase [Terriglobia bacterium]|nr:isoaspartyl peptidase/L-asparaginase [Terriglobia bacterium]
MRHLTLLVHGGAGTIRPEVETAAGAGAERALAKGWAILEAGGQAIDACEQAVIELEDDPVFDAGVGAHLNRDGYAQLDAILMDGHALQSGAVAAVERIRNPIRLARRILEKGQHSFLVGAGAEQFAVENGIPFCDPAELITPYQRRRWTDKVAETPLHGTVGAVAIDASGNLCAATSTGGTFFKHPGRVGDSPLIGCGCYADNETAAVSCTGHGESIMKIVMAKAAADFVAAGHDAQSAADAVVKLLTRRTSGTGGLIIVDRDGRAGAAFSTPHMTWAMKTSTAR